MINFQPTFDAEVKEVLDVLPQQVIDWGTHVIGAQKAWAKRYTGKGVKFGVIDTGIDHRHPDLAPNVAASRSFVSGESGMDVLGHGTHVTGIIAGCNNGTGMVGVGSDAEIYSAKVFNSNGQMPNGAEEKAFEWLAHQGVTVINMSYGGWIPIDLPGGLEAAKKYEAFMKQFVDMGITLVAASGNSHIGKEVYDSVMFPARLESTLGIGAIAENLRRAGFSSAGDKVDFGMPGVDVYSTYLNGQYARLSGTSMAAPYFTGCVVVLQQWAQEVLGKYLSPSEVRKYLKEFAVDLGIEGFDVEHGYGKVNIGKVGTRLLNQTKIKLDAPPTIINGRTLAPLRAVVELGGGIFESFDNNTKTIKFVTGDGRRVTMQVGNNEMIIDN